jgi:hypothetical protein
MSATKRFRCYSRGFAIGSIQQTKQPHRGMVATAEKKNKQEVLVSMMRKLKKKP